MCESLVSAGGNKEKSRRNVTRTQQNVQNLYIVHCKLSDYSDNLSVWETKKMCENAKLFSL